MKFKENIVIPSMTWDSVKKTGCHDDHSVGIRLLFWQRKKNKANHPVKMYSFRCKKVFMLYRKIYNTAINRLCLNFNFVIALSHRDFQNTTFGTGCELPYRNILWPRFGHLCRPISELKLRTQRLRTKCHSQCLNIESNELKTFSDVSLLMWSS